MPEQEPNHIRRIAIAGLALSAIATPIVVILIAPHLAPWNGSGASSGQVFDNTVLLGILTPIASFLIAYFAYSLTVFRQRDGEEAAEGVAIRGDSRVQTSWLAVTILIVLFLAIFGTAELADAGSGGGQGPSPVYAPSGALPIQVIGQQWEFTYRFPTFGGLETAHLELPNERTVELHVTSLDVIHSFWSPQLGLKADANPGVDNVAYVRPQEEKPFEIRCSELCGLWHGYMFDTGRVVGNAAFLAWIHRQQRIFGPVTKRLPKYETHYFPEPERRGG
ncbi:MAG TPA: cytochrome c oxidase subunit II [Solirubrobacterales bacterium]|nr:cytochrome c oxidase subunit II [Solirubrobacterales bacterium]